MRPAIAPAMKSNKLLQVIVVCGAGLTGGMQSVACGGTVDAGAAADAAADSRAGYGRISIDAAYGKISVDSGYGRIMPAPLDSGFPVDLDGGGATSDADAGDANEAG
jgi:hypothetical protein